MVLLAAPVDVDFRLEGIEPLRGQVAIRWLFGLARLRLAFPRVRGPSARRRGRSKGAGARGGARRRRRALAAFRLASFRRRAFRFVGDLARAVRPRELRLRARLGLGDPADTGRLWALVGPLQAWALSSRGADVRIEPEFLEGALELQAQGRLRLVPLQLLGLAVSFVLSPSSIRAWRALRSGHA